MALWQFDLELMPDHVVCDAPGCIDENITDDGLDTSNWWGKNQPGGDFRHIIDNVFPPLNSWSSDVLRWGAEDAILVEAFLADDTLEGISVRVDVRNAVRDSIAELTKLAIALECHLYVMETQKIVAADVDLLLSHLAKSSAVTFAHDPKGYVERIARETGE